MEGMTFINIAKNANLPQRLGNSEKNLDLFHPPFRSRGRTRGRCSSLHEKATVFIISALFTLISHASALAENAVELNNNAVQLMNHGKFDDALADLLKANTISPTDESIKKNIAVCYTLMGNSKMKSGNTLEAVSDYKDALDYSKDPNIRFYKGYAHYKLKEYDDAVYELEKAQDSGLSTPEIYITTGMVFYEKGEMVSAVNNWVKGSKLYPENKEFLRLLAKAEREKGAEKGFESDNSSHFIVQFDAGRDEALSSMVLDVLEDAYSDINLDLSHFPEGNTTVILYTKQGFKEATQSPDWSGGVYDGKIRLPIGGVKEVTKELKAVLYHEYAHVVIRSITGGRSLPTWFNEGVADYESARFAIRPLGDLKRAAKKGKLLPVKSLEGGFSGLSDKDSCLAYLQSYSLVNYMVDRFGLHAVRDILERTGRKESFETAFKKSLEPYGVDYADFLKEWEESLKQ